MSGDRAASSSPPPSRKQAAAPKIFGINSSVAVTLALVSPIIFTLAVYSDSFSLSWNEGRGGFIFAMAFIAAELIGLRQPVSKKKFLIVAGLAAVTIGYFAALSFGLHDSIQNAGLSSGVRKEVIGSWMFMWDFGVMALFVGVSLAVLFGRKWYKIAPAGAIYLAGSAIILSLDAFFPYDSLGPLQVIVPVYLQVDQAVVRFIDSSIMDIGRGNVASAHGNMLLLNGLHGPFALEVFWPSAGVHSMIIYTLVMLAFLLKMDIPIKRKLIYFAIGTFGTVAVNIVRITSLTMYALIVTVNPREWEAFHSVAGEIMFLPWIGIYLGIVMFIEGRRMRRLHQQQQQEKAGATSAPSL